MYCDRLRGRTRRLGGLLGRALAILALGALGLAQQAAAANYFVCDTQRGQLTTDPTRAIRWRTTRSPLLAVNVNAFPNASPFASALAQAVTRWNFGPQNFTFLTTTTNRTVSAPRDNFSDISFVDQGVCPGGEACTPLVESCALGIFEADVFFVKNKPFTTSELKTDLFAYGGGFREFRANAMHELGHALGLAHTANAYSLMGDTNRHAHDNGTRAFAYAGEDATHGAIGLYGLKTSSPISTEDVGVSRFRRCGQNALSIPAGGPTSQHCFVNLTDGAGQPLPGTFVRPGSTEVRYNVRFNQLVTTSFMYENNGKTTPITADIGFYLSTDENITTADLKITSVSATTVTMPRDLPSERIVALRIPARNAAGALLTAGRYYLGVIIDPTSNEKPGGKIPEFDENNAAYLALQVDL